MLKVLKNLVNKIKFKFKGTDNQEFQFNGPEINYLPNDEELTVDLASGAKSVNVVKEFNPREYRLDIGKLSKNKRTYLLRGLYGKDKWHLIHILVNTKKPRVRKKLVKRIMG